MHQLICISFQERSLYFVPYKSCWVSRFWWTISPKLLLDRYTNTPAAVVLQQIFFHLHHLLRIRGTGFLHVIKLEALAREHMQFLLKKGRIIIAMQSMIATEIYFATFFTTLMKSIDISWRCEVTAWKSRGRQRNNIAIGRTADGYFSFHNSKW